MTTLNREDDNVFELTVSLETIKGFFDSGDPLEFIVPEFETKLDEAQGHAQQHGRAFLLIEIER